MKYFRATRTYLSKAIHLKQVYLFIILAFITQNIYSAYFQVKNNLLTVSDINTKTIQAARTMLNRELGDWRTLEKMNQVELTKKLNAMVYNFCKNPGKNTVVSDINSLFEVCETACGGRSYVLRGLLAVYGIDSKYQNIYNIPIQGNHSTVEVKLRESLVFFDPTFGTFFTRNNINDTPMSLDDVKFSFDAKELPQHVYQAKKLKSIKAIPSLALESMYTQGFESNYLDLASYVAHESAGSPHDKNILYLSANIYLENNAYALGCLDALTSEEASSCFLQQTNQLYSTSPAEKQVSYNFNMLGYYINQLNVKLFNFNYLEPGRYYVLTLLINNGTKAALPLNLGALGGGIILPSHSKEMMIKPGLVRYKVYFKAKKNEGILSLYSAPERKYAANLYAMKVEVLA